MLRLSRLYEWLRWYAGLIWFRYRWPGTRVMMPGKLGTYYSQDGQDSYLSTLLFQYIVNGAGKWVVDVGCNHPILFSNSLFFERYLGCRVLAIDAISEFGEMWKAERPGAVFCQTAVGSESGTTRLFLPVGDECSNMFSYTTGGLAKVSTTNFEERPVKVSTLTDILAMHLIDEVLIMSIDIEGQEMDAIKGIDFEKVFIACLCVENNSGSEYGSDEIRRYLTAKGYEFHSRIGYLDDVFIHGTLVRG